MNNFIFQNSTKVYFGKGCVKEYLTCLTKNAQTILLAYGGGSIKRNGGTGQSSGYDSGRRRRQHHGLLQSCLSGCPV